MTGWSRERFAAEFGVSRETLARFDAYHDLLLRWNRRINLISRGSEVQAWGRHFADSAQLWPLHPPEAQRWLDFGSGAGFPGLVVAILAAEADRGLRVELVESDARKLAFLGTVSREVGVDVGLHGCRIEQLAPVGADVVSARALAPLDALLGYAEKHLAPGGICLFPKGASGHKELEAAQQAWRFDCRVHPSWTDSDAAVFEIGAIARV